MDDLLNDAPCGFLVFSDNGDILLVNNTLSHLLGYNAIELHHTPVKSILSPGSVIFYQTHFFPMLKMHGKVEEIYLSLKSKTGEPVPVLVNGLRKEWNGVLVNHCVLVTMHQRHKYEDEILEAKKTAEIASRTKDEFLAMVSHELRTPLSPILTWARMLQTEELDEATTQQALESIERNAKAQATLIEDLLDFARITSGKLRMTVQPVDLFSVIHNAIDVVRPAADAKRIRLQTFLESSIGPISGDPERLQQILWNILSNAIKFTPKDGQVQVHLARVNSHVTITISDTGQGIDADFLPHVFERFKQANVSGKRQGGLGLGLAITRELVELHGGTINVYSKGLGQGTTFTIKLPLMIMYTHDQPNLTSQPKSVQDHSLRTVQLPRLDGINVLAVDDTKDARETLSAVLKQYGASVITASTTGEALHLLDQAKPDVIISDIEMPGEDGYIFIRKVRELLNRENAQIPAIALTAHATGAERMKALTAGFQMHIPKPVEPAELILVIANIANRTRSRE